MYVGKSSKLAKVRYVVLCSSQFESVQRPNILLISFSASMWGGFNFYPKIIFEGCTSEIFYTENRNRDEHKQNKLEKKEVFVDTEIRFTI
jgi:hypothetical protein